MADRVVVVGGGIAGASAAAFLAVAGADVTLVERETTLAFHTTGRSAAQWIVNYGHPATRRLTHASRIFFDDPPAGSADGSLLEPRPFLLVARPDQDESFADALTDGSTGPLPTREIPAAEAAELCPIMDPGATPLALIDESSMDIDVGATHQAFIRILREHAGSIATATRVDAARPHNDRWVVETTAGELDADVVVNAAGAWGDVVAETAGVKALGLQPRRRTAFMVSGAALPGADMDRSRAWPMLVNVDHDWYVKPDGSQFLCSPAEQTPTEPADAKPEEVDIAIAIDRINRDTRMQVRSVASSWAGLRTFAPDESMVLGPDPDHPRFIWAVGQGGVGIQTAPAAGQLVADLTVGAAPSFPDIDLGALRPDRLR